MKVISIKCPNCLATLEFSGGGKSTKCSHCGTPFTLQSELSDRLKLAFQQIAQSNYSRARDLLEEALVIDPEEGKVYFAMLLCDLSVNSAAKLTKVGRDFTRMASYQSAIQYLDPSSRAELEQCAAMNKQYMASQGISTSNYPTPLMEKFNKENNVVIDGKTMSLITLYLHGFARLDMEQKIAFDSKYGEQFERVIALFKQLSADEIRNLTFFDEAAARQAFDIYNQFKADKEQYIAHQEEIKRQSEEDDEDYDEEDFDDEDEEEYDEEEDEEEYEEDFDEEEYEQQNQELINQYSLRLTSLRFEVVSGYSTASIKNVPARTVTNNGRTTIFVDRCYTDNNGNFYNEELFPIRFVGEDRIIYILSKSAYGESSSTFGISSNNGNQYIGNINMAGAVINNNGSGISFGNIGNNSCNGNPVVIINDTEFDGDFDYKSNPIK